MKKILYLSRSGQFGGMEKHILDLIKSVNNDYQAHIFCAEGEMVKEYAKASAIVRYVIPQNSIDFSYMKKVRQYVINNQINIVHSHELEVSILGLIAVADLKNVKKIMHIHTPITSWKHNITGKLFKAPLNFIANFIVGNFIADRVIALTESIREERVKKELIRNSKIVMIPNSINTDDFSVGKELKERYKNEILDRYKIPADRIIIGNLSRLTREKGHNLLITAFAKQYKGENYHLLIAGGGELAGEYDNLIKQLDIYSQCTITGIFAEEDKVKLYSTFDYFVFPSLAEGFGYVLVEAMSMGLPILASNIEVLHDVSENNINFFKVGDVEDLSVKLTGFILAPYNYQELQKNYLQVLNKYSFTSFKNNYLSLYNSLL